MRGIGNSTPSTVSALYGSKTPQVTLAIDQDQQTLFVHPELYILEVEFTWAPGNDLLIQGGLGLQSTEITEARGSNNDEKGHGLPFASAISFNLVVSKNVYFEESY